MPQLVKKRRSGWAVLAAGALVASLLAVGATPAAGDEIKAGDANTADPDATTIYSSCVGPALEDRAFPDVNADSVHRDNINCLAYYGITIGKSDGSFAPTENVRRSQMVLFMQRAAALAKSDMTAVLADFASMGEGGDDIVNRTEMAKLIAHLIAGATANAGPYAVAVAADGMVSVNNDLGVAIVSDYFVDARAAVPRASDSAIGALFELGVVEGTGDGSTFSPGDNVTRAQMAAFIMRAMSHTNLRPAGVTAQSTGETNGIRVSVRDDNFAPVVNKAVDLFTAATSRADDVFADDGTCTRLSSALAGTSKCTIAAEDPITDINGNVVPSVEVTAGNSVWAWTGADAATVGSDTELFKLDVPEGASTVAPNAVEVTTSLPEESGIADCDGSISAAVDACQIAHYGATVTYTIQLKGTDPATSMSVDAGPAQGGASYTVVVTYPTGAVTVNVVAVDENGTGTFDVTVADPDPTMSGLGVVSVAMTSLTNPRGTYAPVIDGVPTPNADDPPVLAPGVGFAGPSVRFDDDASVATTVVAETASSYAVAPGAEVRNVVTVTVLDQYGEPQPGVPVNLKIGGDIQADAGRRSTVSTGKYDLSYTHDGTAGSNEIGAVAYTLQDTDNDATTPSELEVGASTVDDAVTFFWASEPTATGTVTGTVVAGGPSMGSLVLMVGSVPMLVFFDSNDQFTVPDADLAEDGLQPAYGMAAFVVAVSGDSSLTGIDEPLEIEATVTGTGYNPNDTAAVTNWSASLVAS